MIIVKLGGSLVNPDGKYDTKQIQQLITVVSKHTEKFLFIIGGGKICRLAQDVAEPYFHTALPEEQWNNARDEIGIAVTKINALYILRAFAQQLGNEVHPDVLIDPTQKVVSKSRIFFAAGWKPGHSTDKDMMLLARTFRATKVYKISNFPFVKKMSPSVYAKAPEQQKKKLLETAENITQITWEELQRLVGKEWVGGMNTPFDPSAAKIGVELAGTLVAYIGGLEQFFSSLAGKKFVGTVVKG